MIFLFKVRALYDFEAQSGTGELSIKANEILTVTNQVSSYIKNFIQNLF